MGVLDRISRLVAGGVTPLHDPTHAVRDCYVGYVKRARQLARHAEMAPQGYSREGLNELALAEERQAERLRDALRAVGETPPVVPDEALPGGALNHWGRLVQDLSLHRAAAQR